MMDMDPVKIMTSISNEIEKNLKAMGKAKTPEEKLVYSEIIKNLCESQGVFHELITGLMDNMLSFNDDDDDDDPIAF